MVPAAFEEVPEYQQLGVVTQAVTPAYAEPRPPRLRPRPVAGAGRSADGARRLAAAGAALVAR